MGEIWGGKVGRTGAKGLTYPFSVLDEAGEEVDA